MFTYGICTYFIIEGEGGIYWAISFPPLSDLDEMVKEYQDLQKTIKKLEREMEELLLELHFIEGSKIDLTNNADRRKYSMEGKLSAFIFKNFIFLN